MNQPLFDLDGRVAIVTGASSGLGERFARVLAGAGAQVVAAARRADRLERLAAEVPGIVACACDVSVDADLQRLVAFAQERFGRLDVLVNNAGVGTPHPAETEPPEHFRHVVDVNLNALFVASQLAGRRARSSTSRASWARSGCARACGSTRSPRASSSAR
jgi:NAD(P)-dependent dehydrogenase (short-subunit alcohol dehydrogenase family)